MGGQKRKKKKKKVRIAPERPNTLPVITPAIVPEQGFVCKPGELCEGVACCTVDSDAPDMSVGDFYRLSRATGMDMLELWDKIGYVQISEQMHGPFSMVSLSMTFPCSFLDGTKCSVYDSRPTGCVNYPIAYIYLKDGKYRQGFHDCGRDIVLTPADRRFLDEMEPLIRREETLDNEVFWEGRRTGAYFPDHTTFLDGIVSVLAWQLRFDPEQKLPQTALINKAYDIVAGHVQHENGKLDSDVYRECVRALVYGTERVKIRNKFLYLPEAAIESYREISEKMMAVYQKHGKTSLVQITG